MIEARGLEERTVELAWRKSAQVAPCLAALAVLLTGCGGGTGGEAAQLARRACGADAKNGGPSLLDPSATPSDTSVAGYDASRAASNIRADLAAKAARLDGRWNILASAFSARVGEFDRYRSAYVDQMNGGTVMTLDDAAKQASRTIDDQVAAECRKALSNP